MNTIPMLGKILDSMSKHHTNWHGPASPRTDIDGGGDYQGICIRPLAPHLVEQGLSLIANPGMLLRDDRGTLRAKDGKRRAQRHPIGFTYAAPVPLNNDNAFGVAPRVSRKGNAPAPE